MEIYYGIPPMDSLSHIKERYDGVSVSENEALSHSIIFLKEMGVPIFFGNLPAQTFRAKKESRITKDGFTVNFSCAAAGAYEHTLPLGLWRSEGALVNGFPQARDYLYCITNCVPIRLFDFYGEKSALCGKISAKTAQNAQIAALSVFKKRFEVLLPHTRRSSDITDLKNRLPCADVGAMIEDIGAECENIMESVKFVFVGSNDLLRAGHSEAEIIEFISKIAFYAKKHSKKLTVCGKITENKEFLASCLGFGVENLCIDEDKYFEIVECFT